jgi:hypothetical protein
MVTYGLGWGLVVAGLIIMIISGVIAYGDAGLGHLATTIAIYVFWLIGIPLLAIGAIILIMLTLRRVTKT